MKNRPSKNHTANWYRKKCVEMAKKIARMRDGYRCRYCGKGEPERMTHGSHVYAEGVYKSMSADVDNIICLCAFHHLASMPGRNNSGFSWHRTPLEAAEWFSEKYPELHKTLRERAKVTKKMTALDWQKKREELEAELNALQVL